MKYTGSVYRPPFEANSLLLQVTAGCSHNKCTFCTMYRNVPFQIETIEQIEHDLREARRSYRQISRIFLVNADPFVLSGEKLKAIATKANEILPEVKTIAMYASIKNIMDKTDDELKDLRALKINELNIGLESAMPEVADHLNKGFTIEEARTQLARLTRAGIDFSLNIIIGAAGREKSVENAIINSQFLNEVKPYLIFVATLHIDEGSPLEAEAKQGIFRENTLRYNLKEEILLLQNLELPDTYFYGRHVSNIIPVYGMLAKSRESMISELKQGMQTIRPEYLDAPLKKGSEGKIIADFLQPG